MGRNGPFRKMLQTGKQRPKAVWWMPVSATDAPRNRETKTAIASRRQLRPSFPAQSTQCRLWSIQEPLCNAAITVYPAVAQKRPVAADVFKMFQIALPDQDFFFIV